MLIGDVVYPQLTKDAKREDLLWFCCAYLSLIDTVRVASCNSVLRTLFGQRGIFLPTLSLCPQTAYAIPGDLATGLNDEEKIGLKVVKKRSDSVSSSTGGGSTTWFGRAFSFSSETSGATGDDVMVYTATGYNPLASPPIKHPSQLDKIRPTDPDATALLPSKRWLGVCPWNVQRLWLDRIRGLQQLRVEVCSADGIEPRSLARILWNNRRTLKSLEVVWRCPLLQKRTVYMGTQIHSWWKNVFSPVEENDEDAGEAAENERVFAMSRRVLVGRKDRRLLVRRHVGSYTGNRSASPSRRSLITPSRLSTASTVVASRTSSSGGRPLFRSVRYRHKADKEHVIPQSATRSSRNKNKANKTLAPPNNNAAHNVAHPSSGRRSTTVITPRKNAMYRSHSAPESRRVSQLKQKRSNENRRDPLLKEESDGRLSLAVPSSFFINAPPLRAKRRFFRWRWLTSPPETPQQQSQQQQPPKCIPPTLNLRVEKFRVGRQSLPPTDFRAEEDLPVIKFPRVTHVAIQLENQYLAAFFAGCRFPACRRILIEELKPVYFPNDDTLPGLLPSVLRSELRVLRSLQDQRKIAKAAERPPTGGTERPIERHIVERSNEKYVIPAAILRAGLGVFPAVDLRFLLTQKVTDEELESVERLLRSVRKTFALVAPGEAATETPASGQDSPGLTTEQSNHVYQYLVRLNEAGRLELWEVAKLAKLLWASIEIEAVGLTTALEMALGTDLDGSRYLSWDLTTNAFNTVPLFDGNHLHCWRAVLSSMTNLEELHLLVGPKEPHLMNEVPMPRDPPKQVRRLLLMALEPNKSLEYISTSNPTAISQALIESEAPKLRTINCCGSYIDCSTFALNVLLKYPRIHWIAPCAVLAAQTDFKDFRLQPPYRPLEEEACAILERYLLRLLEQSLEKLTIRSISKALSQTFCTATQSCVQHSAARQLALENERLRPFMETLLNDKLCPERADVVMSVVNILGNKLNLNAIHALIPPTAHFPKCLALHILGAKYYAFAEEKAKRAEERKRKAFVRRAKIKVESMQATPQQSETYYNRVINLVSACSFGSLMRPPNLRMKPRLQVTVCRDVVPALFAALPKFHLGAGNTAALSAVLHVRRASTQLRGLSGTVHELYKGLQIVRRSSIADWRRPDLKCVEVHIHNLMVRCICSLGVLIEELRHFRQVTELRIKPRKAPAFLTTEEIFARDSPEASLLSQIVAPIGFQRNFAAEVELHALYRCAMFVFTRPWSFRRQYLRLCRRAEIEDDADAEVYYATKPDVEEALLDAFDEFA